MLTGRGKNVIMENKIEEYKKQFRTETLELIVRISWCREKGKSGFNMLDNYYIGQARFNEAFNVRTGELLETVGLNWLEWLAPKKVFGLKYGYKFKEGNMYRLLVREYIPKENDKFKKYYIEQVLEQDVREAQLDTRYRFESKFEEENMDLIVLIKQRICGWRIDSKYRIPKATFIASIDNRTNELSDSYGTLTWIEKDSHLNIKFNFEDLGIYLVRVRQSKEHNNSYMLLDVKKMVTDDRLESIREKYLEPVILKNELGEFKLDRNFNWFEGQMDYFGGKCPVYMRVEEGETAVDIQFRKLKEIFHNLEDWDKQLKEYVSNELLELANEWCEDETEITKKQFLQRIGIPEINIGTDGTVEIMFNDDNMFNGHTIVVDIDENGEFTGADIVG